MNLMTGIHLALLNAAAQWKEWRRAEKVKGLKVGRQVLVMNEGAWHYGTVRQLPEDGDDRTLVFYVDAHGGTCGRWYEPSELRLCP